MIIFLRIQRCERRRSRSIKWKTEKKYKILINIYTSKLNLFSLILQSWMGTWHFQCFDFYIRGAFLSCNFLFFVSYTADKATTTNVNMILLVQTSPNKMKGKTITRNTLGACEEHKEASHYKTHCKQKPYLWYTGLFFHVTHMSSGLAGLKLRFISWGKSLNL